jgi:hypothetical protein
MAEPSPVYRATPERLTNFAQPPALRGRFAFGDRRTAGWVEGGFENLCCPFEHHVKDGALMLSEDVFRCRFKPEAGARECGILIWTLYNVRANVLFSAEVDMKDLDTIRHHADVLETLRYLGATMWPRVRREYQPRRGLHHRR